MLFCKILCLSKYAPQKCAILKVKFVYSGGVAHTNDLLAAPFSGSEAEAFAERMVACGVPNSSILREPISKNTG
jgi:uncharacterized SAM-binding protein YcdF (DUF218 family)